jgi:hypothetical protein
MNSCDYFITDTIVVDYDGGSEALSQIRIQRSRIPRWAKDMKKGQSVASWVEENEDLMNRVVYEDGVWHVKTFETILYIEELGDFNIAMSSVVKITRSKGYLLN